jgi:hypothetical protein
MFKTQATLAPTEAQSNNQKERLDEILRSIDGLIFSIKMETYQSVVSRRAGNGSKTFEYTPQEMMAKKSILFSLIPPDELYAITKKKSHAPRCS